MSNAQIGKKVGLSTEVVHYRVKRLEEGGLIRQYHTAVNYARLGLLHFKICLRFSGISLKEEESFYRKLGALPEVIWIAKCQGEWDCMISSTVRNISELDAVKDKILCFAAGLTSEKSISVLSDLWSFPRAYLVGDKEKGLFRHGGDALAIDGTDLRILRVLTSNARMPIVDIALKLGSTVKIVGSRIRKMRKSGVINNFRLVLDYDKAGIRFFKAFIYIKNADARRMRQLLERLNQDPNLVHLLKVIGDWDLEPEFEFFGQHDFQETAQRLMDEFPDTIKRISLLRIVKEYKYTFFNLSRVNKLY